MSLPRRTDLRVGVDAWGLAGSLYFTGMGQYAANLLRWLPRVAPDVDVTAYGAPMESRPAWLPDAITWRPVGRSMPAKLSALYSWTVSLPAAVRRDGVDVFHAPAVHMRPFFPPVPELRCPVVATLHDLIPMTYYDIATLPLRQRVFYRWNLRRAVNANALVTVSEHSRGEIAATLGADPAGIRVIHNAVDFVPEPDPLVLTRLGVARPYVLFAGSHEPRKNLAGAIEAFSLVARVNSELTLVAIVDAGSGHSAESRRRLMASGLDQRARLVSGLADHDLRALYSQADVVLFPSLAEGFGLPPLQAAACGVPVVASDLPVIHEVLDDYAIYVDPKDPRSIAAGIERATVDLDLRESLRLRGPSVAARFSPPDVARKHADLYRSLARSHAASAHWRFRGAQGRRSADA
jgi:glycosyltransferase involved in cell wall biosynthesis